MRKITETQMINHVLSWLSEHFEKAILYAKDGDPQHETFKLQHAHAIKFVAMGPGWCEFDLHLFDHSYLEMEAWVDREETEITITNRNVYEVLRPCIFKIAFQPVRD